MASKAIAVPDKQDFGALRLGYLQNAGLDPSQLTGLDDQYLQNANSLYQNLASTLLGLENQRTGVETDYARGQSNLADQQRLATDQLRRQMAFRGLLGSSAQADKETQLAGDYAKQGSGLEDAYNRAIAGITGGATAANQAYTTGESNEGLNLAGAAKRYLADLANKQVTQANAVTAGQGDVNQTDIQTQIQQAVAKATAATNQAPDLSKYANLFIQNQPTAPAPTYTAPPVTNPYKTAANPYLANPFGLPPPNSKPAAPIKPTNQFSWSKSLVRRS